MRGYLHVNETMVYVLQCWDRVARICRLSIRFHFVQKYQSSQSFLRVLCSILVRGWFPLAPSLVRCAVLRVGQWLRPKMAPFWGLMLDQGATLFQFERLLLFAGL